MKKKVLCLVLSLAMTVGMGITAFAAPVKVGDSGVFDAEYYAQNNPDVVAAVGSDFNSLWAHYTMFGLNEGRLPFSPDTDWQAVLASGVTQDTIAAATTTINTTTQTVQESIYNPYLVINGVRISIPCTIDDVQNAMLLNSAGYSNVVVSDINTKWEKDSYDYIYLQVLGGNFDYVYIVGDSNTDGKIQFGSIIPGISTSDDLIKVYGEPTRTDAVSGNIWYYEVAEDNYNRRLAFFVRDGIVESAKCEIFDQTK